MTAGRGAQTIAACCHAKLSATRGGSKLKSSSDRGAGAGQEDRCLECDGEDRNSAARLTRMGSEVSTSSSSYMRSGISDNDVSRSRPGAIDCCKSSSSSSQLRGGQRPKGDLDGSPDRPTGPSSMSLPKRRWASTACLTTPNRSHARRQPQAIAL